MEVQRSGTQTTAASTGQADPRVMNKCPTFSGRDTERRKWSFILESVAAMANFEPAMEGAFAGLAEKPFTELTPEMKLGAKQLYYLLVNTVRRKIVDQLVRSSRDSTTEHADGGHAARCSWTTHSGSHGESCSSRLGLSRCGTSTILGPAD